VIPTVARWRRRHGRAESAGFRLSGVDGSAFELVGDFTFGVGSIEPSERLTLREFLIAKFAGLW